MVHHLKEGHTYLYTKIANNKRNKKENLFFDFDFLLFYDYLCLLQWNNKNFHKYPFTSINFQKASSHERVDHNRDFFPFLAMKSFLLLLFYFYFLFLSFILLQTNMETKQRHLEEVRVLNEDIDKCFEQTKTLIEVFLLISYGLSCDE